MKLRIVQIEDGRYAVQQKKSWGESWEWLSLTEYYDWSSYNTIEKYCLGSLEDAESALQIHIKEIKMRKKKPFDVVKVIKVIRV